MRASGGRPRARRARASSRRAARDRDGSRRSGRSRSARPRSCRPRSLRSGARSPAGDGCTRRRRPRVRAGRRLLLRARAPVQHAGASWSLGLPSQLPFNGGKLPTRLCCIAHAALTSACIRLGSIRAIEPAAPIVPTLGYRPGLDGLRALAVTAVILYHGDVSWARGGFLGVDVFFVLSGFLITSLLLTEHGSTGRVDLGRFWTRRARRLLPALFGVLLGVALYAAAWGQSTELGRIR